MENIDLTKLDVKELKSLAYDFLVQQEQIINNIRTINVEIQKRGQQNVLVNVDTPV